LSTFTTLLAFTFAQRYTIPMIQEPYTKWSDRLAFDLALRLEKSGDDMDEILERHQVTSQDLISFGRDPVFSRKVSEFRDEIRNKGVTFRMKAKAQAEELLTTSWVLIHSPDVGAAVKADLIKWTAKVAGLEPKGDQADVGTGGGGVRIQINLGGESLGTAKIVDATPIPALDNDDD